MFKSKIIRHATSLLFQTWIGAGVLLCQGFRAWGLFIRRISSVLWWLILYWVGQGTRYLIQHYGRCFCEDVFWMKFIFKLVDFELSILLSLMEVGLIQPVEVLTEQRMTCRARGTSASQLPVDLYHNSSLGLQPYHSHSTDCVFTKFPSVWINSLKQISGFPSFSSLSTYCLYYFSENSDWYIPIKKLRGKMDYITMEVCLAQ
jgi:hypothetical protein